MRHTTTILLMLHVSWRKPDYTGAQEDAFSNPKSNQYTMICLIIGGYIRSTCPTTSRSTFYGTTRDTLRTTTTSRAILSVACHAKPRYFYRGGVWRCRVMSSGPKEQIKNFYKRSPFDSVYGIKTDKYSYTGLIGIVLRFPPINGSLTPRLFLHLVRLTEKKRYKMVTALRKKHCCLCLGSDESTGQSR